MVNVADLIILLLLPLIFLPLLLLPFAPSLFFAREKSEGSERDREPERSQEGLLVWAGLFLERPPVRMLKQTFF